jgi:hypothetical protein
MIGNDATPRRADERKASLAALRTAGVRDLTPATLSATRSRPAVRLRRP